MEQWDNHAVKEKKREEKRYLNIISTTCSCTCRDSKPLLPLLQLFIFLNLENTRVTIKFKKTNFQRKLKLQNQEAAWQEHEFKCSFSCFCWLLKRTNVHIMQHVSHSHLLGDGWNIHAKSFCSLLQLIDIHLCGTWEHFSKYIIIYY